MIPHTITLADGKQRKFSITLGTFRRIKERTGKSLLTETQTIEDIADIIAESLVKEDKLTAEEVADLMPLDRIADISMAISKAMGIDPKNESTESQAQMALPSS